MDLLCSRRVIPVNACNRHRRKTPSTSSSLTDDLQTRQSHRLHWPREENPSSLIERVGSPFRIEHDRLDTGEDEGDLLLLHEISTEQ